MFDLTITKLALKELKKMPPNLQAATFKAIEELALLGFELKEPKVRHIKDGLKELRVSSLDGISRSFFFFEKNKQIYVIHVLHKKTQKTPQQSIQLALSRMNEIKEKLNG
ncbi:type II toxin-antitoxin system RelE/ParE family toxin [Lonepinella sp. MS14437]|uniref:type II toxin-antitoxin system RelE/ParE family toxin n=1 Tax=Lonepinella sp. MS14437 TaxID=3003620 RepID=UPI0036DD1CE6